MSGIPTNPPTFEQITPLFCDVYVAGALIIASVLCLNDNFIVRDAYLGFSGDLAVVDTQGNADPEWQGLGTRWLLTWWPPTGSAQTVPLVIPTRAVANQTLATLINNQQIRINLFAKQIEIPVGPLPVVRTA